jgi:hypothetical protein
MFIANCGKLPFGGLRLQTQGSAGRGSETLRLLHESKQFSSSSRMRRRLASGEIASESLRFAPQSTFFSTAEDAEWLFAAVAPGSTRDASRNPLSL